MGVRAESPILDLRHVAVFNLSKRGRERIFARMLRSAVLRDLVHHVAPHALDALNAQYCGGPFLELPDLVERIVLQLQFSVLAKRDLVLRIVWCEEYNMHLCYEAENVRTDVHLAYVVKCAELGFLQALSD